MSLCTLATSGTHYVDQASLKLTETHLPLLPKCWYLHLADIPLEKEEEKKSWEALVMVPTPLIPALADAGRSLSQQN